MSQWPLGMSRVAALAVGVGVLLGGADSASAGVVWTGPTMSFTKPDGADSSLPANQDRLTPNVWITRGSIQGLYNARTEAAFTHFLSPADTRWADGTLANCTSLTYVDWNTWALTLHGGPLETIGVDAVVHLISEDIYLSIKITSWSASFGGGFSYIRSTPSACLPGCITDVDDGSGTGSCDGGVTIDDLLYYLRIFEDGNLTADVDDGSATGTLDGGVTIDDLLYYLFRFEAGC